MAAPEGNRRRRSADGALSVLAALRPRKDGGLAFLLEHIANTEPAGLFPMYTDAVAVAGLNAFESFGRRAVLLVLGRILAGPLDLQAGGRPPVPRAPPRAALRLVPRNGGVRGFALGPRRRSRHEPRLRAAYERLRSALDSQAIVWVEGRLLPQEIEIAPSGSGVELVR